MPQTFSYPIEEIRAQFPILDRKVNGYSYTYLDTAATAHKPKQVIDAITSFYSEEYATVNRAVYLLAKDATAKCDLIRRQILEFLGADETYEAVFTSGTTESLNLVVHSFAAGFLSPGDEVIVFSSEHHSNLVPWQMAEKRYGLCLKVLPVLPSGDIDLDAFKKQLSPNTRLVSLAHISNITGAIHPIQKISSICKEKGIYTVVDGAQSVGHVPVNLNALGCDFFAFSGHKVYGPTGIGVLVGRKGLLEKMEPLYGGGDMIDEVSFETTRYATSPQKFEAGTPKIAQIIGLGSALDYVLEIGIENIEAHEKELISQLLEGLGSIPSLKLVGKPKERSSIVSFTIKGIHSLDLATLLDLKGIAIRSGHLCAQPYLNEVGENFVARISTGLYTSASDIENALQEIQALVSISI